MRAWSLGSLGLIGVLSLGAAPADEAPSLIAEADVPPLIGGSEHPALSTVVPEVPDAAYDTLSGSVRCEAILWLDVEGVPHRADIHADCPEALHAPTQEALLQWEFEPYRKGGDAQAIRTQVVVLYDLGPASGSRSLDRAEPTEADEPPMVELGSLKLKKSPAPTFPASGADNQTCNATVWLNERGQVYKVTAKDCPEAYQNETTKALLQWRWANPKVEGETSKVRTQVKVDFNLGD